MDMFKSLINYVKDNMDSKTIQKEGHVDECQVKFFEELLSQGRYENIGEIGFNMGHSAITFLENSKNSKVWSFDINRHKYTLMGRDFIDNQYPNRLNLICGNSAETVPLFIEKKKDRFKFDLIFIDGGHSYKMSKSDILNMKKLANEDTIVIIDDIRPEVAWGKGPSKALNECIENGIIINVEYFDNSKQKGKVTRRWAKANYAFL